MTGFEPAVSWSQKFLETFLYPFVAFLVVSAPFRLLSVTLKSTVPACSERVCGNLCGQKPLGRKGFYCPHYQKMVIEVVKMLSSTKLVFFTNAWREAFFRYVTVVCGGSIVTLPERLCK
ncbi:MAG: hypothetical protein RR370_04215, partial [Synergistaceae bacterium]